jgi:two-component system, NarL family, nitrate/nitrite response regulator NarL
MMPANCEDPSTCRSTAVALAKPAGTVLLLAKARLLREMIGRILTDGGYIVLDEGDGPTFGPQSNAAWNADLVIVIRQGDEFSGDAFNSVRHAARGKIILLLIANQVEEISKEVLVAVDGVLNDEVSSDALLQALKVIQSGERVVSQHLAPLFTQQSTPNDPTRRDAASLSPREKEIVTRLVRGESNKIIGHALHITEATVKVHLKAILRKISVQNRTQAAIWAVNNGFDRNIN